MKATCQYFQGCEFLSQWQPHEITINRIWHNVAILLGFIFSMALRHLTFGDAFIWLHVFFQLDYKSLGVKGINFYFQSLSQYLTQSVSLRISVQIKYFCHSLKTWQ